jgi:hypothetical protein
MWGLYGSNDSYGIFSINDTLGQEEVTTYQITWSNYLPYFMVS